MKSNGFFRQILIAVLIVALFSVGLFVVLFLNKDMPVNILSAHDFDGATAVVYTSEGDSTGANCPVYSLGDKKYLALFNASCDLAHDDPRQKVKITRNGDECEIVHRMKKETRPVEKAQPDGKKYEFFGGEISFYPFGQGWISAVFLMNHAGEAEYECVRFGNLELTAKEYHDAYPEETDGLLWDEKNEVYVDKMGGEYKTRHAAAYEVPVVLWTQDKDAYVSFYLTDADYSCVMENKVFELMDIEGGKMSALFWETEK